MLKSVAEMASIIVIRLVPSVSTAWSADLFFCALSAFTSVQV